MNDEEIKECLECCISLSCEGCPLGDERGCLTILDEKALELINRQQAEIKQAKSEAIKEFAERFIDEECAYCSSESDEMIFFKERFDNFFAEMAGGENA